MINDQGWSRMKDHVTFSTSHLVNLSSCHHVNLSSCHLAILPSCHLVILSSCPLVICLSVACKFVRLSIWAFKLVSFWACASWSLRACLFRYYSVICLFLFDHCLCNAIQHLLSGYTLIVCLWCLTFCRGYFKSVTLFLRVSKCNTSNTPVTPN